MYGIERRARNNIYLYALLHSRRFEDIQRYSANPIKAYGSVVKDLLPLDWNLSKPYGIWQMVTPPTYDMPTQGFKLHISATYYNAAELIRICVPILVRAGIPFKFLVDEFILEWINARRSSRVSSGKFITIYPISLEQFKWLAEVLSQATAGFSGPYILTDKRYEDSKTIYYRWGGFTRNEKLNVFGEKVLHVRFPNGVWKIDERHPIFQLPEGIQDPFDTSHDYPSSAILNNRYQITQAITILNKGGVYRAYDTLLQREVIIKEARPFVNLSRAHPHDAITCLRHEYAVLQRLSSVSFIPKPYDFFVEWEHAFLVMELCSGVSLASFRAYHDFGIALQTNLDDLTIRTFCEEYLLIAQKIIEACQAIHAKGIILQDLSPNNILYDRDTKTIRIIDFESAYIPNEDFFVPIRTIGFGKTTYKNQEKPTFSDDYFSCAEVLYNLLLPANPLFALEPVLKDNLFDYFISFFGLPDIIKSVLTTIPHNPKQALLLIRNRKENLSICKMASREIDNTADTSQFEKNLSEIASYIIHHADYQRSDAIFPCDYRIFTTNPLNLSFGLCGIGLLLKHVQGDIPEPLQEALLAQAQSINLESYTPGFYIGIAGIAASFHELGYQSEAQKLIRLSRKSPLLEESLDLFYGLAGWGFVQLYFFHHTKDIYFLQQAELAATKINRHLKQNDAGLHYFSQSYNDSIYYGLGHGASGVGLFYLKLYQATQKEYYLTLAESLLNYDLSHATTEKNYALWSRAHEDTVYSPYWRIGSAGIGTVLIQFYRTTHNPIYLSWIEKISCYLRHKFTVYPALFNGMAGIGEFFIDLYQLTGNIKDKQEAFAIAERILIFKIKDKNGIVFPGDELMRISVDYGTGSSGIGLFLHRLIKNNLALFYDF